MDEIKLLAKEFKLREEHVKNIITLIDGGSTIPFIARYRKEMTGECDDQVLRALDERLTYVRNLDKRKTEVLSSIREQEKLTPELEAAINEAATLAVVEDLYRPYKPKRRTRATIAREKGLAPLADAIFLQQKMDLASAAEKFINEEKGVLSSEDALAGAHDIIAEMISDSADARAELRDAFHRTSALTAKAAKEEKKAEKKAELAWLTDLAAAKKQAAEEKKPILMFFTGSDWCIWCQRLHEGVLDKPEFADFSKKLVLVELDFPQEKELPAELKKQNAELAEKFKVDGYPCTVVLASDGETVLGKLSGYSAEYIDKIQDILDGKGKPVTMEELKKQFDYADRKSIPFLSITGGNEVQEGIVNIKNLTSGEQKSFSKDDIAGMTAWIL